MTDTQQARTPQEGMKKGMQTQMLYMMSLVVFVIVIANSGIRNVIGTGLDFVFMPVIGFGHQWPVITLLLAGMLIGLITSIPRYFFTDWVKMGKAQNRMRVFSQTMRDAYRSGQRDRIQKLRKMQQEVMLEQQQVQMNTMKPLMIFSIVTYLIFIWLFTFVGDLTYSIAAFPWNFDVNLTTRLFFYIYNWIVVYFLAVMVTQYFVSMVIKWIDFSRRLRSIESYQPE